MRKLASIALLSVVLGIATPAISYALTMDEKFENPAPVSIEGTNFQSMLQDGKIQICFLKISDLITDVYVEASSFPCKDSPMNRGVSEHFDIKAYEVVPVEINISRRFHLKLDQLIYDQEVDKIVLEEFPFNVALSSTNDGNGLTSVTQKHAEVSVRLKATDDSSKEEFIKDLFAQTGPFKLRIEGAFSTFLDVQLYDFFGDVTSKMKDVRGIEIFIKSTDIRFVLVPQTSSGGL